MRKELLLAPIAVWGAWKLSTSAFSLGVRKEIGRRDNWTCQGVDSKLPCVWEPINGEPANFHDGYWVQASHIRHEKDELYNKSHNGRIQCSCCHFLWELECGNPENAKQLLINADVFTYDARRYPEEYPDINQSIKDIGQTLHLITSELEGRTRDEKEESLLGAIEYLTALDNL